MRIRYRSSDVGSSALPRLCPRNTWLSGSHLAPRTISLMISTARGGSGMRCSTFIFIRSFGTVHTSVCRLTSDHFILSVSLVRVAQRTVSRSEEHTSELQSLMRISYAVFCLKKTTNHQK